MKPLDLKDLGSARTTRVSYTPKRPADQAEALRRGRFNTVVKDRSRNIVLTDDYAPVENLLAPVAETRGDND